MSLFNEKKPARQGFSGYKEKQKISTGKKRRGRKGGEATNFMPLIFFDEDEDGNVIERVIESPAALESLALKEEPVLQITPDKHHDSEMADTQPDEQAPLKKKEVSDIGRLAHIAITNYYGTSLSDQQRVDRFNDLRAFQLLVEANFDQGE